MNYSCLVKVKLRRGGEEKRESGEGQEGESEVWQKKVLTKGQSVAHNVRCLVGQGYCFALVVAELTCWTNGRKQIELWLKCFGMELSIRPNDSTIMKEI
ncbi:hypothetical protein BgiMline_015692 [Biomphalaria glabrata]